MQSQARSRKRAAPGASPRAQQDGGAQAFSYQQMEDSPLNDQSANFRNAVANDTATSFPDLANFDANFYSSALNGAQPQTHGAGASSNPSNSSNQLVRRSTNQQLTQRTPQRSQWSNFNNSSNNNSNNNTLLQNADRVWENMEEEDEPDLDQKAAIAKKDAQAKRKQIPPFVQKLSSFLDSSNNTELIRWSDDGNSFIVLDEDEFARTLIPELFKHNNYASFVRQLNMYGFHKKVGLNANSMKAAEKKVKDPNVYWHEYFKRGRPDLLWLIQKPQGKSSTAKRKRNDDRTHGDSDDDGRRASPEIGDNETQTRPGGQRQISTLPRSEMQTMQQELNKLQRQQSVISKMIAQLKEQNEQFYRQATAFQALHDRHENSINAILTFLATFYNRSLEGHAGANLVNMFGNAIPQNNHQHGSVVDVGDFPEANIEASNQLQRYQKRPLALLPPPMGPHLHPNSASPSVPPASARSSHSPANNDKRHASAGSATSHGPPPRASVTPVVKDDAETPNLLSAFPENDDMMSLINAANASSASPSNNGPNFDFSSALDHYQTANGASPLTQQQRDDMLSMIANQGQPATSQPGANNALVTPTPPPMPSLEQMQRTQEQLDMLSKLQQEQDSKVAHLAGRLQPLSPTGAIPGLANGQSNNAFDGSDPSGGPGDFDINAFINSDDNYFNSVYPSADSKDASASAFNPGATNDGTAADFDLNNLGDASDWDFSTAANGLVDNTDDLDLFGEAQGDQSQSNENSDGGGRIVGSVSSEGTSPAARVEDVNSGAEGETPGKRRKVR
ncbi:hypothetical protein MBLNU459_g5360t1 [Dothideomycetes sp. NU459]